MPSPAPYPIPPRVERPKKKGRGLWWKIPVVIVGSWAAVLLIGAIIAVAVLALKGRDGGEIQPTNGGAASTPGPRYTAEQVADRINTALLAGENAANVNCPSGGGISTFQEGSRQSPYRYPNPLRGRTPTAIPPPPASCKRYVAGPRCLATDAQYTGDGFWRCGYWTYDERQDALFLSYPTPAP